MVEVAVEPCLVLSSMLAGGIATVLEFVSVVRPEAIVALVDCKECTSEKVDDLKEDEHMEKRACMLTLSMLSESSTLAGTTSESVS